MPLENVMCTVKMNVQVAVSLEILLDVVVK